MQDTPTQQRIDVRPIAPRDRHPMIFDTWAALAPGESILLVNDHDPVPLYYQFAAEHPGAFRWEYLEAGPDVFEVQITKGDFPDPGFVPTPRSAHSCSTPQAVPIQFIQPFVLDTRPIFARGDTPCKEIDDAIARLIPGQSLVLLAPFEPVPLYAKLGEQGFRHETRQIEGGVWRVEFRKGS